MVTVLDGHPHTLGVLAGVRGVPAAHLGVSGFGQSGDLASVYRYHGLDTDSILGAALDLIDEDRMRGAAGARSPHDLAHRTSTAWPARCLVEPGQER